jgi:alpha-mannosidase
MFKDVPGEFDAWDIDSMYEKQPVELTDQAEFEVIGSGPLVAKIRIRRKLHNSQMEQVVSLRRGQRMLTFETTIDWQERHKLLKVAFPVDIHADHALHEIQFGHVTRPNHRSRQYDVDRFEVCNHKWTALAESARGLAVLNDCKYGVNVLGKTINLTLLKSALAPDMHADLGTQTFTYALRAWNGPLIDSHLVQAGYELNVPVRTADGGGGHRSFLSVDADNVVVETVKAAEDGSGDLVVRLYESMRTATDCTLSLGCDVKSAHTADMLESADEALTVSENQLALTFRPFEIKTLRLTPAR